MTYLFIMKNILKTYTELVDKVESLGFDVVEENGTCYDPSFYYISIFNKGDRNKSNRIVCTYSVEDFITKAQIFIDGFELGEQ